MTDQAACYADALYALAVEAQAQKQIWEQLEVLARCFEEEPSFVKLLLAANIPVQERCSVLEQTLSASTHRHLLNFLKLLTEYRDIALFPECVRHYAKRYDADQGIVKACAVTAVPLGQAHIQRLAKRLGAVIGKRIVLENTVEPGQLGGILLRWEDKQVDATLRGRLAGLQMLLDKTELEGDCNGIEG